MRLGLWFVALAALAWSSSAQANTLTFGAPINNSSCSLAGSSGDRSCTSSSSINNGALDASASAQIVAQASADHGVTTNPDASADITVSYSIPYTVTRTVTVTPFGPGPATLSIPTQQINLNFTFTGQVSKDNSQVGGGLGQAFFDGPISVLSSRFGAVNIGSDASQLGGGGLARTNLNFTTPDITGIAGRNFDGAAGEISLFAQIPTNYRDWEDFLSPFAMDYSVGGSFTQSFTDTLVITFRLRAESRPSGSVSTTGGEAIACAGQVSPLGSFTLDNSSGANCGSGFQINASVTQTGTTVEPVPEPTTLLLLGLGVAGLAAAVSRRRAA